MHDKLIAAFDTSAINRLADDPGRATLLPKIQTSLLLRLSFTSVGELIATRDAARRSELLALCKKLMYSGDCIHNGYQLLQMLISDFERSQAFDWTSVDIRFQRAEDGLRNGAEFDDVQSQGVLKENREANRKFEKFYNQFNRSYKDAFLQGSAQRPASLKESLERLRESVSFETMASRLYAYVAERDPKSDRVPASTVNRFLRACPPFNAYLLGLCAARYTRNLKPSDACSMKAGALDTAMAVCLPYCDIFVTNDCGMQKCFKEISAIAGLPVEVLSHDCFRQRLIIQHEETS